MPWTDVQLLLVLRGRDQPIPRSITDTAHDLYTVLNAADIPSTSIGASRALNSHTRYRCLRRGNAKE